ncbi:MAG: transporter [Xanthomonadales bacterium]|jgi:hypothetical protein|nr:transporter [Xanthomonadales bacterium]
MTKRRKKRFGEALALLALLPFFAADAGAQDLEPRRWSHLPTGTNVLGVAAAWTDGEIFADPVLRIEDAKFEMYTLNSSYIRTYDWFGKSGRIDFRLPYSYGRWEGLLDGRYASTRRHGFSDPSIRVSMNLYGAPPLKGMKYVQYRASRPVTTTVGAALSLTLPLGEYYPERLINLGNNRYVYRAQLGVLHQRGPWQFEVTTTASFYQDNDEFYANGRLEQDPLWFFQGHLIRSFKRGMWASLSSGFSYAGETQINGVPKDNDDRTRYLSLSFGMPITNQQSLKITWINADTNVIIGSASDTLVLGWSLNWGL